MTKKGKLMRNILILLVMLLAYMSFFQSSYSSKELFDRNELTYSYGPSTILKEVDIEGKRIYFARYDKWMSYTSLRKGFLGLWYLDHYHVIENDRDKQIEYTYSDGLNANKKTRDLAVFGYINDSQIARVELELEIDSEFLTISPSYSDETKFFFFYPYDVNESLKLSRLLGYDASGKLIFEYDY